MANTSLTQSQLQQGAKNVNDTQMHMTDLVKQLKLAAEDLTNGAFVGNAATTFLHAKADIDTQANKLLNKLEDMSTMIKSNLSQYVGSDDSLKSAINSVAGSNNSTFSVNT
jgi:uncharacterized protein YukE